MLLTIMSNQCLMHMLTTCQCPDEQDLKNRSGMMITDDVSDKWAEAGCIIAHTQRAGGWQNAGKSQQHMRRLGSLGGGDERLPISAFQP